MPDDSPSASSLSQIVELLTSAAVDFVIVGLNGINFFARDPSQAVATRDLDVLLRPAIENLQRALGALRRGGYAFEAGGEPFLDEDNPEVLATVIARGAAVTARSPDGVAVDLMFSGAGLRFDDLSSDAVRFLVGSTEVRVGALEKLLRSKQLAGRPKDLEFLRMFAARFADEVD